MGIISNGSFYHSCALFEETSAKDLALGDSAFVILQFAFETGVVLVVQINNLFIRSRFQPSDALLHGKLAQFVKRALARVSAQWTAQYASMQCKASFFSQIFAGPHDPHPLFL